MLQKVRFHNVKKLQRVLLSKDLPVAQGFGNRYPVKESSRGDITSNGFEEGRLKVRFYFHSNSYENVEFNELSAANYLLVDIY